ncbi:DUF418 domain-containing protein [Metasolibacillus sp.]|uniref:DUF418 domain-containing protein n=1 Tax=Metasolibacillus sp. TaxID=2703680 RepID=UPI0025ECDB80|nr:DUF418 domain-containing protein [Metasolibacillus sp.]MCT6925734.1 DUF418 domain-containing protein [Metasolibacillus sp.]MCT6941976.1 DUF418 domain-containing protein [Metasolibacillus sp.]
MSSSVTPKERIQSLDIIRGFALFGILFINIAGYQVLVEGGPMPDFTGINKTISSLINVFVEKKFFSIFSFLFGVGFYIFASRAEARGDKPRWRFVRRLAALFLIGVVHIFIFWGSILVFYAVIGFLLLPFYKASLKTIRNWLIGIIVVHLIATALPLFVPATDSFVTSLFSNDSMLVFIMFLSGFYVSKAGWIQSVKEVKPLKTLFIVLLPFAVGSMLWIWFASIGNNGQLMKITTLGTVPITYCYLILAFWIFSHPTAIKLFQPVAKVGRMALTNYIAQSFIALAIMGMMGIEVVNSKDILVIAPMVFAIQVVFSVIYFKFFNIGPLEKLWRWMTGKPKQKVPGTQTI